MCKNSCRVCACCEHLILYIVSDEWHVVPQNTPAKDIFVWIQRGSDALVLAARSKIFGEWWSATICLYVSLVQTERSERSQTLNIHTELRSNSIWSHRYTRTLFVASPPCFSRPETTWIYYKWGNWKEPESWGFCIFFMGNYRQKAKNSENTSGRNQCTKKDIAWCNTII